MAILCFCPVDKSLELDFVNKSLFKFSFFPNKNALSLEKYLTQKLIQKNAANFKTTYKGFR